MTNERIRDGESSKAREALQVEEGDETVARLAARYEVHPCQNWIKMKALTQGDAGAFDHGQGQSARSEEGPRYRGPTIRSAN